MGFNLTEKIAAFDDGQKRRLQEVQCCQAQYGMAPRNDSILTHNYAIGDVPPEFDNPYRVARELVITHAIFQATNYGHIVEEVMREVASHFKFKYRLGWNETWELTRFYVPEMLKLYCVRIANLDLNAACQLKTAQPV